MWQRTVMPLSSVVLMVVLLLYTANPLPISVATIVELRNPNNCKQRNILLASVNVVLSPSNGGSVT